MSEETLHETRRTRSRRAIASYLSRVARALRRGEPVPADEAQTVTVDPAAEADLGLEVDREGDELTLEMEIAWPEGDDDVDTDAAASKATFELYEDNAEEWRWRLVHDNGNIIADSGEGYASKQKANQGLRSVQANAPGGAVEDLSKDESVDDTGASDATFELFEDNAGGWRWRLRHSNGEIIADGGQGYASKQKAKQGLRSVQENAMGARVDQQ